MSGHLLGWGDEMKGVRGALTLALCLVLAAMAIEASEPAVGEMPVQKPVSYAGSKSCRECHDRFYQLWSSSFHGLAMQPYSLSVRVRLTPHVAALQIGDFRYRADLSDGTVIESGGGKEKRYPIEYAMGGKNVFYFLTFLGKGRLQTLPVAYDLRRQEWFDTALSGVRHFPGQQRTDAPIGWKEWPYTFNTACHDCHVSQRATSYDPATDTFSTTWKEPGINCETCHGPSDEHNRTMRALPRGEKPADYRIIRTKPFTPTQHNDACNSCHAKMAHLTSGYRPGERFFDHFDLVTLEDPDYYPDGRDLGENYTKTSWMLSPCVKKSSLNCITCHTSSGRYRFRKPEDGDKACLPCHDKLVADPAGHSRHPAGSPGARCVACHMPTTEFARMRRTDHSMRSPMPAATLLFKSPNACNGCHTDRDAAWADLQVRKLWPRDYQAEPVRRAGLVDAARRRDWKRLPEMAALITDAGRDEIFATSLIRLIDPAEARDIVPVLLASLRDPSPLVRGAAADALAKAPSPEVLSALVEAASDEYRLVRVMAAASLSAYPESALQGADAGKVARATDEYLASLKSRPISWVAHYNLGNYHLGRNRPQEALAEYVAALRFEPRSAMVFVNSAIAHAQLGEAGKAEDDLLKALAIDSRMAVAHYNLALLMMGRGEADGAERHFTAAVKADPSMADAAYNLCLITVRDRQNEALSWCGQAAESKPDEPRYAYALAAIQHQMGDDKGAVATLTGLAGRQPSFGDGYLLLGEIYERAGKTGEAVMVYRQLLAAKGVEEYCRRYARERLLDLVPAMLAPVPAGPDDGR